MTPVPIVPGFTLTPSQIRRRYQSGLIIAIVLVMLAAAQLFGLFEIRPQNHPSRTVLKALAVKAMLLLGWYVLVVLLATALLFLAWFEYREVQRRAAQARADIIRSLRGDSPQDGPDEPAS